MVSFNKYDIALQKRHKIWKFELKTLALKFVIAFIYTEVNNNAYIPISLIFEPKPIAISYPNELIQDDSAEKFPWSFCRGFKKSSSPSIN